MDRLIYLYGLIPATETSSYFPSFQGFDGQSKLYTIELDKVTAIVCDLDPNEYSEEIIKDKIDDDMEWLKEKAFHHHETLLSLYKVYNSIIPLTFCTIYKSEQSLYNSLRLNEEQFQETFQSLEGNEEWNLKIYCNEDRLKEDVRNNHPEIEAKRQEIDTLPPGRQFFEKKKLEKKIETELENVKSRVCESSHDRLTTFSDRAEVKRNLSKDTIGMKDNMAWNSVFLVPIHHVDTYLEEIKRIEKDLGQNGWRFEVTGPWPAYHFSRIS